MRAGSHSTRIKGRGCDHWPAHRLRIGGPVRPMFAGPGHPFRPRLNVLPVHGCGGRSAFSQVSPAPGSELFALRSRTKCGFPFFRTPHKGLNPWQSARGSATLSKASRKPARPARVRSPAGRSALAGVEKKKFPPRPCSSSRKNTVAVFAPSVCEKRSARKRTAEVASGLLRSALPPHHTLEPGHSRQSSFARVRGGSTGASRFSVNAKHRDPKAYR